MLPPAISSWIGFTSRRRSDGRCDPQTLEYNFPGDESFIVLSGAVRIDLMDDGTSVELRSGDVASFPKGTRSVWTVLDPIEKFTVVSG